MVTSWLINHPVCAWNGSQAKGVVYESFLKHWFLRFFVDNITSPKLCSLLTKPYLQLCFYLVSDYRLRDPIMYMKTGMYSRFKPPKTKRKCENLFQPKILIWIWFNIWAHFEMGYFIWLQSSNKSNSNTKRYLSENFLFTVSIWWDFYGS